MQMWGLDDKTHTLVEKWRKTGPFENDSNCKTFLKPFYCDKFLFSNIYIDKLFVLTLFHLFACNAFYPVTASFAQTYRSVTVQDVLPTSI